MYLLLFNYNDFVKCYFYLLIFIRILIDSMIKYVFFWFSKIK